MSVLRDTAKKQILAIRTGCLAVIAYLLTGVSLSAIETLVPNGDFADPTLTHGNGEADSLDLGWYAKNADDGVRADPINWSSGKTVGTADILTQLDCSGSKTRAAMFFTKDPQLAGTGWSFEFDLGGTGTFDAVRIWAGTLAGSPTGRAFNNGSDNAPADSLVDGDGWTEIVNFAATVASSGHMSAPISQDLSDFDVLVIKLRGQGDTSNGTTYANLKFLNEGIPNTGGNIRITSITSLGSGVFELTLKGENNTSYEFYSSTTLDFTPPSTLIPLTVSGTPGQLDVTTDGSGNATVQMSPGGSANFVRAGGGP